MRRARGEGFLERAVHCLKIRLEEPREWDAQSSGGPIPWPFEIHLEFHRYAGPFGSDGQPHHVPSRAATKFGSDFPPIGRQRPEGGPRAHRDSEDRPSVLGHGLLRRLLHDRPFPERRHHATRIVLPEVRPPRERLRNTGADESHGAKPQGSHGRRKTPPF